MDIRPETLADFAAIDALLVAAFGREGAPRAEADLVLALRALPGFDPALSLVAEGGGRVAGYLLFTPVVIETPGGGEPSLGLAPLATHRAFAGGFAGSALVREGHRRAAQARYRSVIVLGDPRYYGRFGFQPASRWGIRAPWPVPSRAFQALELVPGALEGVSGLVRYPAPFDAVS
jgi:putative acetyltransferase